MRVLLALLLTLLLALACGPAVPATSTPTAGEQGRAPADGELEEPPGRSETPAAADDEEAPRPPTAAPTLDDPTAPTVEPLDAPTVAAVPDAHATPVSATAVADEAPVELERAAVAEEPLVEEEPCVPGGLEPLPSRGDPNAALLWEEFRAPLPPASQWDPPGPKRVGLQVGHWRLEEVPEELGRLQGGSSGGGMAEWEVALEIAQRTAALLEAAGVAVDILPATVPIRYRAHAFVSIHADGDGSGQLRGFKVARPGFSSIPEADDRLVAALNTAYEPATGLPSDDEHISRRMLYYYAFNSRRYCHAVAPGVPQAIVETGFLTSAEDRAVLLNNPDAPAIGIAEGLLAFFRE